MIFKVSGGLSTNNWDIVSNSAPPNVLLGGHTCYLMLLLLTLGVFPAPGACKGSIPPVPIDVLGRLATFLSTLTL
jgi:hypothetical protein